MQMHESGNELHVLRKEKETQCHGIECIVGENLRDPAEKVSKLYHRDP